MVHPVSHPASCHNKFHVMLPHFCFRLFLPTQLDDVFQVTMCYFFISRPYTLLLLWSLSDCCQANITRGFPARRQQGMNVTEFGQFSYNHTKSKRACKFVDENWEQATKYSLQTWYHSDDIGNKMEGVFGTTHKCRGHASKNTSKGDTFASRSMRPENWAFFLSLASNNTSEKRSVPRSITMLKRPIQWVL